MKQNGISRSKVVLILLIAVLLVFSGGVGSLLARGRGEDEPSVRRLNMGGGWVTGVYYPLAGSMSRIVHLHMDGVSLTVESSGASVVNSNLIGSGDLDLAIVQNDVASHAFNGRNAFDGNAISNMRGLFSLYPEPVQLIARAGSGINSPSDLRGKRVALGPLGSGAEVNSLKVLEAAGLTEGDLTAAERLEAGEAADYLRDGRLDAAFFTVAIGAAVISDLAVSQRVEVVNIDGRYAERLMQMEDFYAPVTIPEGTYTQVPQAQTVGVVSIVVAREDLPEQLVYDFVKAVFDNINVVHSAHAAGRMVTIQSALDGMTVPLHPGAERYLAEQGLRL
ncbi:MAG: TAXI family TRAP transporter solute-binding subunit [Spirochaetaceae bacterium]|nr:MAG: TAXI family TRAP transporter solute-binding subunit [Spirochaetaceae bacterium]